MQPSASLFLIADSLIGSALAWAPPRPPTPYPRPPSPDSGYGSDSNGRRRYHSRSVDLVARHLSDLMEDLEVREANLARRELGSMEEEDVLYI